MGLKMGVFYQIRIIFYDVIWTWMQFFCLSLVWFGFCGGYNNGIGNSVHAYEDYYSYLFLLKFTPNKFIKPAYKI